MAVDFNRQKVINNLMALIQNSGMKVGDAERSLGVSAGYLSRLSKKENDSALSAEFIWKISQLFGVSVDTLVREDINEEDKMIGYMRKFITKLATKTAGGELTWTPITVSQINNMLMGNSTVHFPVAYYRGANYPREKPQVSGDPVQIDYALSCYGEMKVVSAAYGGIMVNPQGTVYYTSIGDGPKAQDIYLAYYCTDGEAGCEEFFELMLVDPEHEAEWWEGQDNVEHFYPTTGKADIPSYVEEICNTYVSAWQPIENDMRNLYRVVKGHEHDIQISNNVKTAIDGFMQEDEQSF